MRSCREENGANQKKYKGVRRRKWGKWVSEIRVPGSQERLWLGSYATAAAAAVAHDVAFYCLRRPPSLDGLNFPMMVPVRSLRESMSPRSVQRAASDAGMGVDAQMIAVGGGHGGLKAEVWEDNDYQSYVGGGGDFWNWEKQELNISVEDYLIK
ncbi:hypothetical protein LWI28_024580 [Acer negundo]|uniref:AP2/ERF domain-containing protein n=1 Tax=Acer negundo TaxID=4023 RepID=A0AAD5IAR9_ACENE|nr:hypothetical protein LWI28_024580 [Acer negundo]KAK4834933.1 hypothetical protein QYF36_002722 [Acer negundo]KAK4836002.1 hypothetical protein QYF36_017306 [Acer negundo]